jgi:hypothetical protein
LAERVEEWTAHDADVSTLLAAFNRGEALTKEQGRTRYGIPERRFRAAVSKLRDQGEPIVSWSQEGSTYRMARDAAEADQFLATELIPRIRELERRVRHIRMGMRVRFGANQQRLIE